MAKINEALRDQETEIALLHDSSGPDYRREDCSQRFASVFALAESATGIPPHKGVNAIQIRLGQFGQGDERSFHIQAV